MVRWFLAAFSLALAVILCGSLAFAATCYACATKPTPGLDPSVAANWFTQKTCVDGNGNILPIDPYSATATWGASCNGYDARPLLSTDVNIPYYHWNYNYTTCAAANCRWFMYMYPGLSPTGQTMYYAYKGPNPTAPGTSNTWYINPHYFPANGQYDTYQTNNGIVSTIATRDGGGFDQIFWGNTGGVATAYNGWQTVPVSFFASPEPEPTGTAYAPISGDNWEQKGAPLPDPTYTPVPTSTGTQTTWYFENLTYDSGKTMETLVSQHQSAPQPASTDPGVGHMEIWYFTLPYGATRWEEWSAATCLASTCPVAPSQYCNTLSPRMYNYQGSPVQYYNVDCHDYSFSSLADSGATPPFAPSQQANLLANPHFSNDTVGTTNAATSWTLGGNLSTTQKQSTYAADQNGYAGVRYLQAACTATCSSTSSISQSVATSGHTAPYAFGVDARTETATGGVQITLAQTSGGAVVAGTTTTYTVTASTAGDGISSCSTVTSVILCSSFIGGLYTTPIAAQTDHLLETITLQASSIEYDLDNVYLGQVHQ